MLDYPSDVMQKIVFADEPRIVLGDNKLWVWYRR
jgi:hypothetical protein